MALAIGCAAPLGVEAPNAMRYDPPSVYYEWWSELEVCTGIAGDLAQVTWYRADRVDCAGQRDVPGCWHKPHTVYMQRRRVHDRLPVKHEMLHDLTQSGHGSLFAKCVN